MQNAVDIVNESPHPVNKVSACLFLGENKVCSTNLWPDKIDKELGREVRIGNSSGTVHAETACIFKSDDATDGKSIAITDPFCPNCAKNIVEAGIKYAYIDHKGFEKDFWGRRAGHFKNMSMEIMARGGVSVYEVNRKNKEITTIYEPSPSYVPAEDSPVEIEPETKSETAFQLVITHKSALHYNRKIAVALAQSSSGDIFSLAVRGHAVIGYSMQKDSDIDHMMQETGKYSFMQEPLNRLLVYAKRKGFKILDNYIYCSQVPTAREQVNFLGAGYKKLVIGDFFRSRDQSGIKAKTLLEKHRLIEFNAIDLNLSRYR
tara:strand:- start:730 stop:1683 length:954 start_codon:yes stop_codon:yes gene_type:complete